MGYTDDEINDLVAAVCSIVEQGESLRSALREMALSRTLFFKWVKIDDKLMNQYTGACNIRTDLIFEEMLDIADDQENDTYIDKDGVEQVNHNVINRSKVRLDTRKWVLGKMKPKKYGDSSTLKLADNEGDKLKVNAIFTNDLLHVPSNESTDENSQSKEGN